jgi:hypothetical protein
MSKEDIWGNFSEGERNVLARIGIKMDYQGMKFTSPPSWQDFTLSFAYISALSRRIPSDLDRFGFVIGDCILEGYRYFGKEKVDQWLVEFERAVQLRDIALNMTGGLLIHLQQVENYLRGCCAYLEIKGINVSPGEIFSFNKQKRKYTLGRMAAGFQKKGVFNIEFDNRLSKFVKDRNHFIHEFWVERILSKQSDGAIPSDSDYEEIIKFIDGLGEQATHIGNVFQGLLFDILYQIGKKHWPDKVNELPINNWQTYLDDFREALRESENNVD